tara:strand:- start:1280 stop:2917 length:1638 start_codon:yes stop_codon:yes gene_type:complete
MESIRVKNLRALKDTGSIKLSPITLALGENSSGKSTFVRLFPLLKQSVSSSTQGPLLFFGPYVDFGSFSDALRYGENSKNISISFDHSLRYRLPGLPRGSFADDLKVNFNVDICGSKLSGPEVPKVVRIEIQFAENIVILNIGAGLGDLHLTSATVNGSNFDFAKHTEKIFSFDDATLIPNFVLAKRGEGTLEFVRQFGESWRSLRNSIGLNLPTELSRRLVAYVSGYSDSRTSILKRRGYLGYLCPLRPHEFFRALSEIPSADQAWSRRLKKISASETLNSEEQDFYNISMLHVAFSLCAISNSELKEIFENVTYLAPIRASAQRYYRLQNLGVREIDHTGENLPIYLAGLNVSQRDDLSRWVRKNLSIGFKTDGTGGHISILIEDSHAGKYFNIADMGFGYSQVLPIVVQIWHVLNRSENRHRPYHGGQGVDRILVIEQPELHLHPKMQANLAIIFVNAVNEAREKGINLKLIVETHSAEIVNALGKLIAEKQLDSNDANIYLFNRTDKNNRNSEDLSVQRAEYMSNGKLKNWPWGFFEPSYK